VSDWFADQLLAWYSLHGRKHLPWQHPRSPYRVWLSEVMLQQTQVQTVLPYFERFLSRFPDLTSLSRAPIDEVLHLWSGLGYYSRARNLHKAAQVLVRDHGGQFPRDTAALELLPGVGRSTAGAIVAMAFGEKAAILDGNVKRVLCRFHSVTGYPGDSAVSRHLWTLAEEHTPDEQLADYTQAIMDLGATVCTRRRPVCSKCPLFERCNARALGAIDRFPQPKPKRFLPEQERTFALLVRADGACLLERRPPSGVWGGLWSPPERPTHTTPEAFAEEFGMRLNEQASIVIQPFVHTFTHFRLEVRPRVFEVTSDPVHQISEHADRLWYSPGDNQPIGLSAVASRLLRELKEVWST
jgi:A/G-specific adenine glycosylase